MRHCPRCGEGHVIRGWFRIVERCPRCNYRFEREEGSWLGAYVVNFGITEAALAVVLGLYIAQQANSDTGGSVVPWLIVGLIVAIGVPILVYPFSKTIWTAIDLMLHNGRPGPDLPPPTRKTPPPTAER